MRRPLLILFDGVYVHGQLLIGEVIHYGGNEAGEVRGKSGQQFY